VGLGREWLYDCHLSDLKSENLAIILSSIFPKGHLNPSGHYWDLFWEVDCASGCRNTAVMLGESVQVRLYGFQTYGNMSLAFLVSL